MTWATRWFKAQQLGLKGFQFNFYLILCQIYSVSVLLRHSRWYAIASNRKKFRSHHPSLLNCVRYVPTCLKCLSVLKYYVPKCPHFSRAYMPTTTHKIYWGIYWASLFYWIILPFIPFKTTTQAASKTAYLNLTLRGLTKLRKYVKLFKKLSKTRDCF